MRESSEDKARRVLSLYSRLKEGRIINKAEESAAYGVADRTIQRDIADIQNFLQNQISENGEVQEVKYERASGGYRLVTTVERQLQPKELLAVCKVLMESRSLVKVGLCFLIHFLRGYCIANSYTIW